MSRLDYPHYRTAFTDASGTLRHPMDYKYRCGFDPMGKSLKKCVYHWQTCISKECQAKYSNWCELKDELLYAYGYRGI